MNEPHVVSCFTQDTLTTYNRLYDVFFAAGDHGAWVHGPQFNTNDLSRFETGTIVYLGSIQGSGGVPLSYIPRNDILRSPITIASPRGTKIFWNVPLLGTSFNADNHRIWTCLAHQYRETPGWEHIQQYQETNNGRQTWLVLSLHYVGRAVHNDDKVNDGEPTYDDDDYDYIDHTASRFDDIYDGWPGPGPMILDKMDLEAEFFTKSDYYGNTHGFNMYPGEIYPEQAREIRRRATSNATNILSPESLVVAVKRVSEVVNNNIAVRPYTTMVLKTYSKMGVVNNNDLHITLSRMRHDLELEATFVNQFREESGGFELCHKHVSFFRAASMYMNERWQYDHEYFQRMIERDTRMNPEVVGARINPEGVLSDGSQP